MKTLITLTLALCSASIINTAHADYSWNGPHGACEVEGRTVCVGEVYRTDEDGPRDSQLVGCDVNEQNQCPSAAECGQVAWSRRFERDNSNSLAWFRVLSGFMSASYREGTACRQLQRSNRCSGSIYGEGWTETSCPPRR